MVPANCVSVLDWGLTDHSAVASRQWEFWIPCLGYWNHWDCTQYQWIQLQEIPATNYCMSIGRKGSIDVALLTCLCGLNAFSYLSDSILLLEQSETTANVQTPNLSQCPCPSVFLQFNQISTHHCPKNITPLVPRTRVCMALMAIGTSICRLSRSDLKTSSLILQWFVSKPLFSSFCETSNTWGSSNNDPYDNPNVANMLWVMWNKLFITRKHQRTTPS